jgi:hypothetical protein
MLDANGKPIVREVERIEYVEDKEKIAMMEKKLNDEKESIKKTAEEERAKIEALKNVADEEKKKLL